jgi:hypothetical protein
MRDAQAIEQLYHHAAEAAAEDAAHDPAMLHRGAKLAAFAFDQLAATQRAVLDRADVERFRVPPRCAVRPGLLAMARAALVVHLGRLEAMLGGELALQHRDLETMTDDDLRSLAADIEAFVGVSPDEPQQ